MLFNSFEFLIFFPLVTILYLVIPKNFRAVFLLLASYYFYMCWNPKYLILILASTMITYGAGLLMSICKTDSTRKTVVAVSLISNLGILVVFKYFNFFMDAISGLLGTIGVHFVDKRIDVLLPVGISFYTFQALGYTLDVYREKIEPERSFVNYALFVSFFPQLVAGPIERSGNLLNQIRNIKDIRPVEYERIKDGILLMLWGLYKKLVIADRASIYVDKVFDNYGSLGFVDISIAAVLFAFQIYCDFGGYTDIARGAAKVFGFSLMDNFRQPYLATSIKDFWRRWHISLTSWFTDYLYIPLGGNRKGVLRKYINILIVFGVSGLWHGAAWHFVAWGLLHAIYQIGEDLFSLKSKAPDKERRDIGLVCFMNMIITFVLVDFAWVFFAAGSLKMALGIIRQMISGVGSGNILENGLDAVDWKVLIAALLVLVIVDIFHERGKHLIEIVNRQKLIVRVLAYSGLIWTIILFGVYGVGYDSSQFIYFQF